MMDADDPELRAAQRKLDEAMETVEKIANARAVLLNTPRCSFCGNSKDDVQVLIEGARGYICDACVELCRELIAAQLQENEG